MLKVESAETLFPSIRALPNVSFGELHRDAGEALTPIPCSESERRSIDSLRTAISDVCENYRFSLQTLEVAIRPNRQYTPRRSALSFVSFLRFETERLAIAYLAAMEAMKEQSTPFDFEPEPIVFHHGLYGNHSTAAWNDQPVVFHFQPELEKQATEPIQSSDVSLGSKHLKCRYEFQLEGNQTPVEWQIEKFWRVFLGEVSRAQSDYRTESFHGLIFPNRRFVPEVRQVGANRSIQVPAGALFCGLLDLEANSSTEERRFTWLKRDLGVLHWQLAQNDTELTLEEVDRRKRISSATLHATVNAIRHIDPTRLDGFLSAIADAPQSAEDLRYGIVDRETKESRPDIANRILAETKRMQALQQVAAAMAAMGEIASGANALPKKFQSQRDESLYAIVEKSAEAVSSSDQAQERFEVQIDSSVGEEGGETWIIPKGYLDSFILQGVFFEILNNAKAHNKDDFEKVSVRVSAEQGADGVLRVVFTNRTRKQPRDLKNALGGFVGNFQILASGMELMDLSHRIQGEWYELAVALLPAPDLVSGPDGRNVEAPSGDACFVRGTFDEWQILCDDWEPF